MVRIVLVLLVFCAGQAFAADPLTEAEVRSFKAAIERFETAFEGDDEVSENLNIDLSNWQATALSAMDQMFNADGEIAIFSNSMATLEDVPAYRQQANAIIKETGFRNRDHYASVGDRVLAAMIRAEMSASELNEMKQIANMPASQLKMVPQQMRPMLALAPKMAAAAERVPASDVKLVKKLKPMG